MNQLILAGSLFKPTTDFMIDMVMTRHSSPVDQLYTRKILFDMLEPTSSIILHPLLIGFFYLVAQDSIFRLESYRRLFCFFES
jgi:hypothetical protein